MGGKRDWKLPVVAAGNDFGQLILATQISSNASVEAHNLTGDVCVTFNKNHMNDELFIVGTVQPEELI